MLQPVVGYARDAESDGVRAPSPFRDSVDDVMLVFGGRAYTGERYACHHPLDSAALTLTFPPLLPYTD